jgi:glycosyltransferase involved in cell wall biosynthesis
MNVYPPIKISIVVPIYNVEAYLPDCINSLINQTFEHVEIILVDDGSPDNCGKICDEYALKDGRIKVIHKENGGLVSARNAGYKSSTGNWVMYLDGDDWLDTNTCEVLAQYITKYGEIDVIFWNNVIELNTKTIKRKSGWKSETNKHLYTKEDCLNLAYHTLVYNSGISTPVCKLIRKAFAENHGLLHNVRLFQGVEGLEFSLRVFALAKDALYIKEYFYHYRYNPISISKRIDKRNTQFIVEGFIEIEKYISELPDSKRFMQVFHQRVLYALIAIAMGTYFRKENTMSMKYKIEEFRSVIKNNRVFQEALKHGNFFRMDIVRMVVLYAIKYRYYFILPMISNAKYYLIKKGFYS